MPPRGAYAGTAGVLGGSGLPNIPQQSETTAYLVRFSSQPSAAYKSALNQAIFRWKAASVYTLLQDLWLFCADAQADSLRNLISASRDATITGAPTFTALKGFSGTGASNYVSLPFSTSGLSATSGFAFAGQYDATANTQRVLIGTSASPAPYGAVTQIGGTGLVIGSGASTNSANPNSIAIATASAVIGQSTGVSIGPAGATMPNAVTGGAQASPMKADQTGLLRLTAYATLPSATVEQTRKFLSILNTFLEDVGALS